MLPLEEPELLGCAAELELESLLLGLLGEALLAPPEAEPDFGLSLEEELDEELGDVGLGAAPLDGDEDDAPADGDEGELDGEEDVLELEEPGPAEVLLLSPRSHAARPKASATAAARMESFMCPPWVGYKRRKQQIARPA